MDDLLQQGVDHFKLIFPNDKKGTVLMDRLCSIETELSRQKNN